MDDKRKRPKHPKQRKSNAMDIPMMNYPGNPPKQPKARKKPLPGKDPAAPTAFRPSPVKNMAYWSTKNGPASALKAGALAAVQGVEKGVKAVKGIKDTVDSLTGKTAMTDAMNAPISQTASGKEAKK